ncbi:hypothetical protein [Metallibacterium scheffleri]|uniref:hypothetical protein n=1 Tax=Metallibacterium scheffleri TaxID=993689 RepID=UPI0023F4F486|nr:hypothetical protein [Metallibacterium scheffleri]
MFPLVSGESPGIQGASFSGFGVATRGGSSFQVNGTLVCTARHDYNLTEIVNYSPDDFKIEKSLANSFAAEQNHGITIKEILTNSSTKLYNVNYGPFTRRRVDGIIRIRASPSYNVLDNVKVYVCAKEKETDQKFIILSCVAERSRGNLNKWTYNVVNYEVI